MQSLLLHAFLLIFLPLSNADSINGCAPKKDSPVKGFDISYYHYPMIPSKGSNKCFTFDPVYVQYNYLHGDYQTYGGGLLGTSKGVTDLSFSLGERDSCNPPVNGKLPANYNFNDPITITNFSMLITGYFYAQKSGEYEFSLDYVDDLSYVNIGAGKAFDCCHKQISVTDPGPFDLSTIWPKTSDTATVTLLEGFYYPLRIFYINRQSLAELKISFKDPDGIVHHNFDGYIYSVPDGHECPAIITTTTVPWTGTFTSTYTTQSTITGSDGSETDESIIVIETPEVETATTKYTPWTGTYTTTYSTDVGTATGSDGVPTIETTFYVETPEVETATTKYTPWTGTYTTTYSTDVGTVTGSDGVPTIETTFYVETPDISSSDIRYSNSTSILPSSTDSNDITSAFSSTGSYDITSAFSSTEKFFSTITTTTSRIITASTTTELDCSTSEEIMPKKSTQEINITLSTTTPDSSIIITSETTHIFTSAHTVITETLKTKSKCQQSKTVSNNVEQLVTVSTTALNELSVTESHVSQSRASSNEMQRPGTTTNEFEKTVSETSQNNPSIQISTLPIAVTSLSKTVETYFEGKANKISTSNLIVMLLALL
ncbi:flocculation protein FLO9 [Kluyveromyces marxianus]|uniref:Flocculation protein FLO9 n=1 Tax=Kluyveromyces marxianus TaxID=4911 RepID=A0ABX6EWF1_KLUMA|nr:flocculation protein FLO9 [Kluyveromyces marxianus]